MEIAFELAPEEHAIVEKALRKAAREAGETGAGRVEVEPGALERIERSAEIVVRDEDLPPPARVAMAERDGHNTPQLRLQVPARDGGRCSNPHCRREVEGDGQCHHIEFWSRGGRTAVWNETLVCAGCHALLHQGVLTLEGPVRRPHSPDRDQIAAIAGKAQARVVEVRAESEFSDSAKNTTAAETPEALRTAQRALVKIGWKPGEARRVLRGSWDRAAHAGRPAGAVTAEELIVDACRRGG